MKYRKFGKLGIELSAFGVGCMRLPIVGDPDKKVIDEAEAIKKQLEEAGAKVTIK